MTTKLERSVEKRKKNMKGDICKKRRQNNFIHLNSLEDLSELKTFFPSHTALFAFPVHD